MKPGKLKMGIVLNTREIVSAALTRLCLRHGLAPLTWLTMSLADFDALVRRRERN